MSSTAAAPRNRIILLVVVAVIVAVVAIVIGLFVSQSRTHGNYSVSDGAVTIESATIQNLGTILVTDQGFALYTYPPDAQKEVACTDRCALNWPPMFIPDGVKLAAGPGVDGSQLSTTTDRDGKKVATYDGWPLYLFTGDVTAGTANGQNQYLDGGYWYVIRPDGEVVMPKPED
ncbi:putative lipoprotein with Yx(FWY)xxD motif [Cryobacterium mesophilum]|uniref:COG4315 family predicted lipoprotein n=1 Tax=Terrimesophilobacter mesophilus TaxID=433647 RepID=UPI0014257F1E|nr:hypothetical protein [Terrimesophilobacter mesophilus]MBB5632177.1 putative lipoprotein with Yx(FWY)xxD motif [Terrimesophilobacter mesophilus]